MENLFQQYFSKFLFFRFTFHNIFINGISKTRNAFRMTVIFVLISLIDETDKIVMQSTTLKKTRSDEEKHFSKSTKRVKENTEYSRKFNAIQITNEINCD